MYIATDISKQWCRRFLEIWQWDIFIPLTRLGFTGRLSEIIARGWGEYWGGALVQKKVDFCLLFKGEKSQQMIVGRQYSPKPSRKVVVELLRFYKKCDYYSWQYIAVVDDECSSPGGFLFSFYQLSNWFPFYIYCTLTKIIVHWYD